MNRWVVFDASTADAARHPEREVEVHSDRSVADALNEAVQKKRPVVLVLPAGDEQVTVARVTPPDDSQRR
jgi:hypothetical protein